MPKIRYVGEDPARDIALPGGCITVARMKWVDLEAAAVAAGIPVHHVAIVQEGLLTSADWEAEKDQKPKAPRTQKPKADPPAQGTDDTASADEEQT